MPAAKALPIMMHSASEAVSQNKFFCKPFLAVAFYYSNGKVTSTYTAKADQRWSAMLTVDLGEGKLSRGKGTIFDQRQFLKI